MRSLFRQVVSILPLSVFLLAWLMPMMCADETTCYALFVLQPSSVLYGMPIISHLSTSMAWTERGTTNKNEDFVWGE